MKKFLLLYFLSLFVSCCVSYAMVSDDHGSKQTVELTQGVDAELCAVLSVNPDRDVGVIVQTYSALIEDERKGFNREQERGQYIGVPTTCEILT